MSTLREALAGGTEAGDGMAPDTAHSHTLPYLVITVMGTPPPHLWIILMEGAVARFQYPGKCITHKCPRHPNKGQLYTALHAAGALP